MNEESPTSDAVCGLFAVVVKRFGKVQKLVCFFTQSGYSMEMPMLQ